MKKKIIESYSPKGLKQFEEDVKKSNTEFLMKKKVAWQYVWVIALVAFVIWLAWKLNVIMS